MKSTRSPLNDVTNVVGTQPTQLSSQGGKWARLSRAVHEVKEKDLVSKVRAHPSVEVSDSPAHKRRAVCNNGSSQISSVVAVP